MILSLCVIAQLCASVLFLANVKTDIAKEYSTVKSVYSNTLRWNSEKDVQTGKYYGFVEPSISVSRIDSLSSNAKTHLLLADVRTLLVPGYGENKITSTSDFVPAISSSVTISLSASRQMIELPYIGSVRAPSAEIFAQNDAPRMFYTTEAVTSAVDPALVFGRYEKDGFSDGKNIGSYYVTSFQDSAVAFSESHSSLSHESSSASWRYEFSPSSANPNAPCSCSYSVGNSLLVEVAPLYQGWVNFTLSLSYEMSYETTNYVLGIPFHSTAHVTMEKSYVFSPR